MLEQSVKLSRLIIFYFNSNFLSYAPLLPNRSQKPVLSPVISFLEQFFSSSIHCSCFGPKSKGATNASQRFCSKLVQSESKFCAIQMAHLIGPQ